MANRKQTQEPRFEPLADLGRKYAAQREAMQKRLIEDWIKNKPTPRKLRNAWIFLIENPDLIQGHDYSLYFYHALRSLVGKMPRRREPSREDIAALVDLCVSGGMSLRKARQFVGEALIRRKTVEAVTRAHQREGRARRDKSR